MIDVKFNGLDLRAAGRTALHFTECQSGNWNIKSGKASLHLLKWSEIASDTKKEGARICKVFVLS